MTSNLSEQIISEEGSLSDSRVRTIMFRVACNILSALCFMCGVDSHNRTSAYETKRLQYCSTQKVPVFILNFS